MNESGLAVSKIAFYEINLSDIYIIHDDLDIKLGEYKIQKGIGPQLHYGISSIENRLGKKDFWRIRIGVDNRDLENRIPGEEYVLQDFNSQEKKTIDQTVDKIITELNDLISK
jgi:PTH1 family peptidyl-tRNA hydrolase